MQPIQSNDVPTQRVRRAVDGCVSPLLSKIRQESLGHTLCGFQLHRHKHPPKCKMVSRVSAERISPHQSCPTLAGSVSEGSALSPGRKPSTGSHVTLQREEMNLHVWIYWRIWAPSGKLSLLWVFLVLREQDQSVKASGLRLCSLWTPVCPFSSRELSGLCDLNVLLESGNACWGVSGGLLQIYRQNTTWQWAATGEGKKNVWGFFSGNLLHRWSY